MRSQRKRRIALLPVVVLLLALPTAAVAQFDFAVKIRGDDQGVIEGESTLSVTVDMIDLSEYHHLMLQNPPAGEVGHKEVIFTKVRTDRASVNLWQAYMNGEPLLVEFEHWDTIGGGSPRIIQKVVLTGAKISAIETIYDGVNPVTERIRLRYRELELTNTSYKPDGTIDEQESHVIVSDDPA